MALQEAKKEGVGQEIILFRQLRKQFSEMHKYCTCGKEISVFEISCPKCILDYMEKKGRKPNG